MRNIALFIAAVAASGSAAGQEPITVVVGVPTARVSFADLNIHTAAGQARLEQRVRSAASDLCLDRNVRDMDRVMAGQGCLSSAIASGHTQIARLLQNDGQLGAAAATAITITAKP